MRERARERKTERDREKRERWETLPQRPERKQCLDRLAQNYLCMYRDRFCFEMASL